MKRRKVFWTLFSCVLLSSVFFLGTRLGLVFVMKGVDTLSGGALTVGSVDGRLASSYTLGDIRLKTSGADVAIDTFQWAWNPLSLIRGEMDVLFCKTTKLDIQLKTVEPVASKETGKSNLPGFLSLMHFRVQDFMIEDVEVTGADGEPVFQLFTFNTSLEYQNDLIVVNRFNAEGPDIGLTFHGSVALQNNQNLDLMGNWYLAGFGFHPSKGTFSLKGPIDSLGVEVSLHDPGEIHVVGVVKDLLGKATWNADVDAKNVNLEKWILYCPPVILSSVHGDMSGDFGHYRGLVVAEGLWGVADNLHLRSDIDGDGLGIVFSSLRIDRKESSAVATDASISWEKLFSWEADLDVNNFAINMFFPDFDGSISSQFHSVGDVTDEGLEATFKLAQMNGRFAEYIWSATGSIGLTEERIFTNDLTITSDSVGGLASVREADLSWVDKLSWRADIDLDHFDPGFLHPLAAGDISGNIVSSLVWGEDLPAGAIGLTDLSGELHGAELSGRGDITIAGKVLSSNGLDLSLGGSRLLVSGKIEEKLGLQFSFESPDLSEIGDNLGGELKVQGQVSGTTDAPHIELDVAGNDLHASNAEITALSGHLLLIPGSAGTIDGDLVLEQSLIEGFALTRVDVAVSGAPADHKITADMTGPDGDLDFILLGKYEKDWLGNLSDLTVRSKRYGEWEQLDSAVMAFSPELGRIEDFCLQGTSAGEDNSTCFSAKMNRNEAATWSMEVGVTRFDLGAVRDFGLGVPSIKGRLDANLEAKGDRNGVTAADASVIIPQLDALLNVTDIDFVPVQLRDSVLTAQLEDQNVVLELFFKDNKGGSLDLSGQVLGVGRFDPPLAGSKIVGELTLEKYSLSSLAAFTGYGVEPTGWVSSSFGVGGTLGQPELYGKLAIQEGGIELPYQGITLENVVIAIDSKESGARVRAEASSDGGRLEAHGFIAGGKDGLEATLHLEGDNFLLVNLPEYSLRVTPKAQIKVTKNRGQIKGRVLVPSGLIAPEELSGAVKVSEDVVYLGEEQHHAKSGYPFLVDLDVELGDEVRVDGYGLTGRLGGKLNVKITPEEFITGRGELDLLDSTFSFYGRSLDIARGRMLFTGGPIDNPGVDIRAQKVITAETARDEEYTVGVDINGMVQDLQFHLFSDPFMEDTDILSQMVVGHSFADSSEEEGSILQAAAMTLGLAGSSKLMEGVGNLLLIDDLHLEGSTKEEDVSLVVGKRITEDLYIGYDMNMFSRLGQFRVRYDLSRGFYVETRSSTESTGADLIYTFRR